MKRISNIENSISYEKYEKNENLGNEIYKIIKNECKKMISSMSCNNNFNRVLIIGEQKHINQIKKILSLDSNYNYVDYKMFDLPEDMKGNVYIIPYNSEDIFNMTSKWKIEKE